MKMMEIIDQLLDVNRIESGKQGFEREPMQIQPAIAQVINSFEPTSQQKKIQIELITYAQPLWIESNPQLFSQIFDNLISNALKYSPPGSLITVTVGDNEYQNLVAVQDQGPGFTDEDQRKMFHQFVRLSAIPTGNENSTGLGLSIVKQLTTILDASLALETHAGQGACFTIGFDKYRPDSPPTLEALPGDVR